MILDTNTEAGFAIASSLRGPDIGGDLGDMLKTVFTARIRWEVLTESGTRGRPDPMVVPYQIRERPISRDTASTLLYSIRAATDQDMRHIAPLVHYLGHVTSGAKTLGLPKLASLADMLSIFLRSSFLQSQNMPDPKSLPTIDEVVFLAGGDATEAA